MLPLLIPFLLAGSLLHGDPLQAGASRIDITPPKGYPLWGYASRKDLPSEGVDDPLQARALVISSGNQRIALVSLDLGRPPVRESTGRIEAELKKEGIDQVFLVASHTHSGPILELDSWPGQGDSYQRTLEARIIRVILEAKKGLQPCRIGLAKKEVDFNRNRHSRRVEKIADRELIVIKFETHEGRPIAHAVNFAAHPTLLPSKSLRISADYPGVLSAMIEKETKSPCLFLQGAAGDLSANSARGATPKEFGKALAAEILGLIRTIQCKEEKESSLVSSRESFQFASRINHGSPVVQQLYSSVFYPALVTFYTREYREGIKPRMDLAILNGKIGFVGVSGEFFTGHSINLKKRANLEALLFLGYCNDYQQYFPTIEASAEGGYGTDVSVSPVETGAGEKMMDRALISLFKLRGKLILAP